MRAEPACGADMNAYAAVFRGDSISHVKDYMRGDPDRRASLAQWTGSSTTTGISRSVLSA